MSITTKVAEMNEVVYEKLLSWNSTIMKPEKRKQQQNLNKEKDGMLQKCTHRWSLRHVVSSSHRKKDGRTTNCSIVQAQQKALPMRTDNKILNW